MAQTRQVFDGRRNWDTASRPRVPKADLLFPVRSLLGAKVIVPVHYGLTHFFHQSIKFQQRRGKRLAIYLILPLSLTGCCHWTDSAGTRHALIIGVGVVSVNESLPQAAQVTRANVLGVMADSGGVTAGFSSRFSTAVPANAEDVRIEASQHPFAPIKIEIQKAQLNQTNPPNQGDK